MIAERTLERLVEKGWKIAFAESCTGGLAAAALVEVPSASLVLDESVVTYADAAKVKYLGVSPETIRQYGVVSEPVAGQMAEGIARAAGTQVGVGISGIAGPTGETPEKPIGMVCFGFWIDGAIRTETVQFGNLGRNVVRQKSVEYVYATLEKLLGAHSGKNETGKESAV